MKTILVTGATGFVGQAVMAVFSREPGITPVAVVRRPPAGSFVYAHCVVGDIDARTDWTAALAGVDVVVHCAARAHVMAEQAGDPLAEYRRVNTEGTLNLARQAVAAGVKRFVFISSIKVNGESTTPGRTFSAASPVASEDPYGVSKQEAEAGLAALCQPGGMESVIIRPPLVYGPGVKANFRNMMAWTRKGVPLPLGAIHNERSLVARENLIDLIRVCIDHPAAAGQTFLVSDGEDLSTTELLRRMGRALGRPARLLPVPTWGLMLAASLLGKKGIAQRLCGNLQVDIEHTRTTLGWAPPVSVDEALRETAEAFLAETNAGAIPAMPAALGDTSGSAGAEEASGASDAGKASSLGLLRLFDVLFSLSGLIFGSPLLLILLVAGYFDTGSPLFRQQRVGRNKRPFTLVKFRTMRPDTASVATHLADASAITRLGEFMRKTKLDELPQIWNVLKGEMSLVGPRPGLFNQEELTAERDKRGVFEARPGITGLAQVNNIDMSTPELLAETDREMLDGLTVAGYFKYILMTVTGKGSGDAVKRP